MQAIESSWNSASCSAFTVPPPVSPARGEDREWRVRRLLQGHVPRRDRCSEDLTRATGRRPRAAEEAGSTVQEGAPGCVPHLRVIPVTQKCAESLTRTDYRIGYLAVMRTLDHPNIVRFVGATTRPPTYHFLTEYLSGGTLSVSAPAALPVWLLRPEDLAEADKRSSLVGLYIHDAFRACGREASIPRAERNLLALVAPKRGNLGHGAQCLTPMSPRCTVIGAQCLTPMSPFAGIYIGKAPYQTAADRENRPRHSERDGLPSRAASYPPRPEGKLGSGFTAIRVVLCRVALVAPANLPCEYAAANLRTPRLSRSRTTVRHVQLAIPWLGGDWSTSFPPVREQPAFPVPCPLFDLCRARTFS